MSYLIEANRQLPYEKHNAPRPNSNDGLRTHHLFVNAYYFHYDGAGKNKIKIIQFFPLV